jgi:uncharacterized repeat protein (TIGR01451 family)
MKLQRRLLHILIVLLAAAGLWSTSANAQTCAAPGKNGPCNLTGVINSYHAGAASTTVLAGANQITLASITGQRTSNRALEIGDQVVVMQMQDSTTPANAGLHEYATIVGVAGNIITLNRGLTNGYAQQVNTTPTVRTFQVIYVPQCSSATISAANTVSADRWDINAATGAGTGGVVGLDVAGSLAINGTITVAGAGFRGGPGRNGTGNRTGGLFSDANYAYDLAAPNGSIKGEGTGGTPIQVFNGTVTPVSYAALIAQGYTAGSGGQESIGNAGGGGNDGTPASGNNQYNSGGGGGGNGGAGGRGGFSWANNNDAGGRGGNVASNNATRLVLGGGGGAGSTNNNTIADAITQWPPLVSTTTRPLPTATGTANGAAGPISSSGASGGGAILIRAGTLAPSTGRVIADGYTAHNNSGGSESAGGGGAGGSIFVSTLNGNGSGLTLSASGGGGGYSNYFDHGPGGGGGGGYVETSLSAATIAVLGGTNGYDGCCGGVAGNGSPKTYNAAPGFGAVSLIPSGTPVGNNAGAQCLPVLTLTKSTSTPVLTLPAQTTAQYLISVSNAATAGTAYGVALSDVLPLPFGLQTLAQLGTTTISGTSTTGPSPTTPNQSGNTPTAVFGVAGSANNPATPSFTIAPGGSITLTFIVNVNTTTLATFQNSASATFTDPTRSTGGPATGSATINPVVSPGGTYASGAAVGGTNYASGSSTIEDVQLLATTTLAVTKTDGTTTLAAGSTTAYTITFSNTGGFAANNAIIKDSPSAGLTCTTVTCVSTTGSASCPAGLTLGTPTPVASVPNLFNTTGIAIATFPPGSSVNLVVNCNVTATGQ